MFNILQIEKNFFKKIFFSPISFFFLIDGDGDDGDVSIGEDSGGGDDGSG